MYSIKDCINKRHHHIVVTEGRHQNLGYINKVRAIQFDNLIAYWPLNEMSGTVIKDWSGNNRNGTYTGVSFGQTGIGDGNSCPLFDGVASRGNIYSTSLNEAFNHQECTIQMWLAVLDASIWTTDALFTGIYFGVDAVTTFIMEKNQASGLHDPLAIANTGGLLKYRTAAVAHNLSWMNWTITYSLSNDRFRLYFNGVKMGGDTTAAPEWVGPLGPTRCVIGSAISTSQVNPWKGRLAHVAIWSKELTPAEVLSLSTLNP